MNSNENNTLKKYAQILIIDGANLLHRARSGFQLGDFNVVFNLFRALKPLIEQFKPDRVYFTLEGAPRRQLELLPEYKANRTIDQTTPDGKDKYKSLEDFWRQKRLVVDLLEKNFPFSVVQHPDFEADDTIYNLIKNGSVAAEWTVVSSDTDFIQLLQEFPNVKLYNPIAKAFVEAPDYDYVSWKSLRGDGSDNIPGLDGVGDKTAEDLLGDFDRLSALFEDRSKAQQFERNMQLIRLSAWTDEEAMRMASSEPRRDWDAVKAAFEGWGFKSMLKDSYWEKFVAAFDTLWVH